ncbi:hypothetical protein C8F04DRAFT_1060583 [Mycena alexandri]|uniref:Nephrocystin 3-like N-terminal domain-containing protein n=1 Tax=Mycena alexandri TaxID=1745969 RepID=A0AAD6XH45_9AGAR|nr:hypothetical protein C8F04DRAFT_1060583 [Mycena alexandri]
MQDETHDALQQSSPQSDVRIAGYPSYAAVSNTAAGDMYMLNCRTTSYHNYTYNAAPAAPTAGPDRTERGGKARINPYDNSQRRHVSQLDSSSLSPPHSQTGRRLDRSQPSVDPDVGSATGSGPTIDYNSDFAWSRPPTTTSIVNNVHRHGETGLHILSRAIAGDAFYDSAERFPQPQCHPETRTRLLDVLWNWACGIEPPDNWIYEDSGVTSSSEGRHEPSRPILWLHGPAGSGKSAVAQSFCQKLKDEGRLGGTFFFKRGHPSRGNANQLFPTLAYQLALHVPELKEHISRAVENDPAVVYRSLCDQLQQLIIEPCRDLTQPVSLVIDGLDEAAGHDIQQEVVRSISRVVSREHLPLRFFVASRPEAHLRETFGERTFAGYHRPLNIKQSFQDVRKYLLDEFDRIHEEHSTTMHTVPYPWPISETIEALVEKSSGYFIYASTVIRFIDDKRFRPVDRLDIVLGIKSSISGSPFALLDHLYHQILCTVPIDYRSKLIEILVAIGANVGLTPLQIELLLELETGDLRLMLRDLQSVIEFEPMSNKWPVVHHACYIQATDKRADRPVGRSSEIPESGVGTERSDGVGGKG